MITAERATGRWSGSGRAQPARHRAATEGFSLIELLVGLAIGLLLIAAVLQLFVGSRATFNATEALARAQESGRFAIATISPTIRSSAIGGVCGGNARLRTHIDLSDDAADALLSPVHAVRGWDYRNTGIGQTIVLDNLTPGASAASEWQGGGNIGDLPAVIADLAVPFSDVLLVRQIRPVSNITAEATNLQDMDRLDVTGAGADQINQCDLILVTNCNQADLFQVSSVNSGELFRRTTGPCAPGNVAGIIAGPGSPEVFWSRNYGTATQFHRFESRAFFVGQGLSGEPALFSATFGRGLTSPRIEELVDGIENMQILFGYSFPGDASPPGDGQSVNEWLTAQTVPNWEYVVAVRIGLLARSPRAVASGAAAQTFDIALTNVTHPADAALRQPHNVTLSLRNRQIIR